MRLTEPIYFLEQTSMIEANFLIPEGIFCSLFCKVLYKSLFIYEQKHLQCHKYKTIRV